MSLGNAYVKGAIRHTIHQHVHGATARHGRGDSHDPFVLFRQFYQRMPEYILKQGRHPVRIGYNTFSCYRIELTRGMPYSGLFFCRTKSLSFDGVEV